MLLREKLHLDGLVSADYSLPQVKVSKRSVCTWIHMCGYFLSLPSSLTDFSGMKPGTEISSALEENRYCSLWETWPYKFNGLLNDWCIQFYDCYTCRTKGPHTSALLFFYILSFLVLLLFLIEIFLWNVSVLNIHSINDQCPGWDLISLTLLFSGPIHGDFCPFWYKSISLTNLIMLEFPQIAI